MYLWLWLTIASGILLGFYDIAKKKALSSSTLLSVLALYTTCNFILVSFEFKNALEIDSASLILIFVKSVVIFISWFMGFIAIRGLPISIITPFGTLNSIFSIILGIFILHERISWLQVAGLILIFISYYFIGKIGSIEISGLFKNKYLYLMAGAMLLSAVSALIDKIALKSINIGQMQFWFSFFVALLYVVTLILVRSRNKQMGAISFSWYIPIMSLLLVVSDRIYFIAVKIPASQISLVMPLRKVSIIVSTLIGGIIFREKNLKAKLACVLILLVGIIIEFAA